MPADEPFPTNACIVTKCPHLLIVDENAINLEVLKAFFSKNRSESDEAFNGQGAFPMFLASY